MKRFIRYIIVLALACVAVPGVQARTITVNAKSVKGDLTQYLRNTGASATYRDTVVLNFDKGSYTIDGSVIFNCHLVIRGMGEEQTTVFFDKGNDKPNFKAFIDDCFFDVFGKLDHPLSASISDISFRVKDHRGIWWDKNSYYIFKIRHCQNVNITRVKSYSCNASLSNFNLEVCSNVYITDCDITNYNNSENGGCIWIRGEMHNINIKRNKITKYGKDEAIAIFDRLVDHSKNYIRGKAVRSDIFIEDNELYYGYEGKDKNTNPGYMCDMVISLFTDHKESADKCETRNFHMNNNRFYINEATTRCMYIGFDPADKHERIYIENNEIVNGALNRDVKFYHKDIEVHDMSSCGDTIHINGNNVRNRALVLNSNGTTGYMFLQTRGGIVGVHNNKIVNDVTTNRHTGKSYGMQLIWCQLEGGDVTLTDNVCKGLSYIAYVGGGDGTRLFTLNARNNYFEGDTRIYSHKIQELNLDFTGNTFKSIDPCFFLQEFAPRGKVVFNYNDVTISGGRGTFLSHWGSASTNSMRFDKLEVRGNTFKGVKSEKDMLKNVTNAKKRKISGNTIR